MNITEQNATEVVSATMNSEDQRTNQILKSLVKHLHAFIREIEPTEEEWFAGIQYLTAVGQKCSDVRQEFILLSDTLGVTALKDCINHRKPQGATEATILGPFYREGAELLPLGASISRGAKDGEPCLVRGKVVNTKGEPVAGALLDVWQAASTGFYEQQDEDQPEMNLRGVFKSDENGNFYYKTVKPKYYPIPGDGPVGDLLKAAGRHNYRPAHIHFIVSAPGMETVTTQFFDRDDPYLESDAVFGVKDSLIIDFKKIDDETQAQELGLPVGSWLIDFDFVLNEVS